MPDKPITRQVIEVPDSAVIEWMYPEIYGKDRPQSEIRISMYHVRATNDLTIRFDSQRNGFVLTMDEFRGEYKDCGTYRESIEHEVEVGFVPAWTEGEDFHDG